MYASVEEPQVDRAFTRQRYDTVHTFDDMRVTSGPGRYSLADPGLTNQAACFAPEPTIRAQKWAATPINNGFTRTDVESDLFNIDRPGTRIIGHQYDPRTNKVNEASTTPPKECDFPQTYSRLVDPPCTGRGVGWNRWEYLCQNPQDHVMMPFDWLIMDRLRVKDGTRLGACAAPVKPPTGPGAAITMESVAPQSFGRIEDAHQVDPSLYWNPASTQFAVSGENRVGKW
jgi:hypothetical protein